MSKPVLSGLLRYGRHADDGMYLRGPRRGPQVGRSMGQESLVILLTYKAQKLPEVKKVLATTDRYAVISWD